MKNLVKIGLLSFGLLSCWVCTFAQVEIQKVKATIADNSDAVCQVMIDYYTALINNQLDRAKALLHPDMMNYASGGDSLNRDGLMAQWKGYHKNGHDLSLTQGSVLGIEIKEGPEAGTWVMGYGLAQWTPNGADQAIYSWTHEMAKVEDGKITLLYSFQDNLPIMLQSGFQLTPPQARN